MVSHCLASGVGVACSRPPSSCASPRSCPRSYGNVSFPLASSSSSFSSASPSASVSRPLEVLGSVSLPLACTRLRTRRLSVSSWSYLSSLSPFAPLGAPPGLPSALGTPGEIACAAASFEDLCLSAPSSWSRCGNVLSICVSSAFGLVGPLRPSLRSSPSSFVFGPSRPACSPVGCPSPPVLAALSRVGKCSPSPSSVTAHGLNRPLGALGDSTRLEARWRRIPGVDWSSEGGFINDSIVASGSSKLASSLGVSLGYLLVSALHK